MRGATPGRAEPPLLSRTFDLTAAPRDGATTEELVGSCATGQEA